MKARSTPLADLHTHLQGSIRAEDFLEHVAGRDVDWDAFESAYEGTPGKSPHIRDILRRHRSGDPTAAVDFREVFVFSDGDTGGMEQFRAKFRLLYAGSVFSNYIGDKTRLPEVLEESAHFTRAIVRSHKRDGISYSEQRDWQGPHFPQDHAREVLLMRLRIFSDMDEPDFATRLAVSLSRNDPWPRWEQVRELAIGPYGEFLTAIDFAGIEEGHPPKDQAALFSEVLDFNRRYPERALAILYHVGESFEDKSLESAIRWVQEAAELGAHRLGHAIALGVNPEAYGVHQRSEPVSEGLDQLNYDLKHAEGLRRFGVPVDEARVTSEIRKIQDLPPGSLLTIEYDSTRIEEVRRRQAFAADRIKSIGTVVEVCPTSNRRIGRITNPDHHPVHQFLNWGVPFVVGSDDPGIFDTSVAEEISWIVEAAQLGPDAFDELASRAWRYRSEVLTGREPQPKPESTEGRPWGQPLKKPAGAPLNLG